MSDDCRAMELLLARDASPTIRYTITAVIEVRNMRKLLFASTLALFAGAAQADDLLGLYAGAGITRAKVQDIFHTDFNLSNTSWKVYAGFRPLGFPFGIDVDYMDLGSAAAGTFQGVGHADAKAFAAYAVGYLPIPAPNIDVYGKAGLARWQFDGNLAQQQGLFSVSDNGTDFAWGVGLQVHFLERFAARVEYEHFNIRDADNVQLYSLGVSYTIL
jgi:opacity protein-like surface antigen